jgi:hypothetical protein
MCRVGFELMTPANRYRALDLTATVMGPPERTAVRLPLRSCLYSDPSYVTLPIQHF